MVQKKKPHKYHSFLQKRMFDFVISLFGLIVFSPLILSIALAIKALSKGPPFFIQKRVGKNGKIFRIIMFRTMYEGAERDQTKFSHLNEADGPVFKIKDDPRNIKIQFLLGLPLGNLQSLL